MKLTLTSDSHLSTTLIDPSGSRLFRIYSLYGVGLKATVIKKPKASFVEEDETIVSDGVNEDVEFKELARIQWQTFRSSRLKWEGQTYDFKDFMPKYKLGRLITDVEGKRYLWEDNILQTNDDNIPTTTVAVYTESSVLGPKAKATLDIDPFAEGIIDLIVISWVYTQKLRQATGHTMATLGVTRGNL